MSGVGHLAKISECHPKTMRHTKKRASWFFLLLVVLFHLCIFTAHRMSRRADTLMELLELPDKPEHRSARSSKSIPLEQPRSSGVVRMVYPNSVIRGGVRNPEELKVAVSRDKVVASHFSGFSLSQSRIVDLKVEKIAYVSYRVSNKVYWSKKKVRLVKGEKVITDGVNYARARCGNRISDVAQTPTSIDEPSHAFLNTPVPTDGNDPILLATVPGPSALSPDSALPVAAFGGLPGSKWRPPFFVPLIIGGGTAAPFLHPESRGGLTSPLPPLVDGGPNPPPTADVPEPGTLLFLTSGLVACLALRRKLSR
jgi:hypothetical protein